MDNDTLFILGSEDPEMERIEEILMTLDHKYSYATYGGERVHPGNAHSADNKIPKGHSAIIFVECKVAGVEATHVIDHHNEGDPGYGKKPHHYFSASSIGQLYALLNLGEPTKSDRALAAMDHCFAAAYRGGCPGVTPEEVLETKIQKGIMDPKGVSRMRVEDLTSFYKKFIMSDEVKKISIAGQEISLVQTGIGYSLEFLTSQLAATILGVPVIASMRDNANGPCKIHLSANTHSADADKKILKSFKNWAIQRGMHGIYYNPCRGNASAYESSS